MPRPYRAFPQRNARTLFDPHLFFAMALALVANLSLLPSLLVLTHRMSVH